MLLNNAARRKKTQGELTAVVHSLSHPVMENVELIPPIDADGQNVFSQIQARYLRPLNGLWFLELAKASRQNTHDCADKYIGLAKHF